MTAVQEYIQILVEKDTKMSLEDFFVDIHSRFYPRSEEHTSELQSH